jgi:antitoxin (DNA-binding transcriptional repressor) of toxin-antitoxin stability system
MHEPKPVQMREFRDHLATYLRQAANGAEIIVMSRSRAVARLGPPPPVAERRFGLLRGRIWMSADFDDTPEELIGAMEGEREK